MATVGSQMTGPIAPLSLDLDDKWSYMKTHGDAGWQDFPSYLATAVPRILSMLDDMKLKVTVFVVGKDAEVDANRELLRGMSEQGHETANHSFMHEPWLHLYEPEELRTDLKRAHEAIAGVVGSEPIGFRGPGYSLSEQTLSELLALGYRYDATVFPNVLNSIGRRYFFSRSNLTDEDRHQREALFGTFRDSLRPNVPFQWSLNGSSLSEVPVTTVPLLRTPFHFSYLIYLAGFTERLALAYLRLAVGLCRARGQPPSLLLHPLDFLGVEDEPELGFFPGMEMSRSEKLRLTRTFLEELDRHYDLIPIGDYLTTTTIDRTKAVSSLGR